jgi:hypothetical protein
MSVFIYYYVIWFIAANIMFGRRELKIPQVEKGLPLPLSYKEE